MFGQLKLKREFFEEKKIKNTKIYRYQDLKSKANSLNETDSLNKMRVFIIFENYKIKTVFCMFSVSFTN